MLLCTVYYFLFRGKKEEIENEKDVNKNIKNDKAEKVVPIKKESEVAVEPVKGRVEMRVVYGSTTGTAKKFSKTFASKVPKEAKLYHHTSPKDHNPTVKLCVPTPEDADGADPWDMLESSDDAVYKQPYFFLSFSFFYI